MSANTNDDAVRKRKTKRERERVRRCKPKKKKEEILGWKTLCRRHFQTDISSFLFAEYFRAHKLEDMQTRMSNYMMKGLGLGISPFRQNISESIDPLTIGDFLNKHIF